jgi:hypothetical protein
MEALTRWLRALIFTPGDSPATGAQEGNRTPDLRITRTMKVNMVRHPGSQSPRKQTSCLNGYAGGDPETVGDVQ